MSDEIKILSEQEAAAIAGGGANGYFWESDGVIYYRIASGDTLSEIAQRAQVPMQQIMMYNSFITNPDKIRVGDIIRIR